MVPSSSDRLAGAARRETIQAADTLDVAKAAREPFDTHLREVGSSRPVDRPDFAEGNDNDQASRSESAASPEDSQPSAGESDQHESATDSPSPPREDDAPVVAQEDEPPTEEQEGIGAVDTVLLAAGVEQQPADESLEFESDQEEPAVTEENDAQPEDAEPRNEQIARPKLEAADEPEAVGAGGAEQPSRDASRDDSSQANLVRDNITEVAADDIGQPHDQPDVDSATFPGPKQASGHEAVREQSAQVGTKVERNDADAQRISEAVAAAAAAERAAETDSQGDEGSQQRRRTPESAAAPKTENAPAETGSVSTNAADRFAQHLTTRGSERSERTLQITEADHRRFVDRVARALPAAEGRGGTLRLRLSPPELGALRLEVTLQNGTLTARVEAETPLARSLLLDSLPVLRERLEEQGVRVDQFDVDLLDRHPKQTPDGLQQQRDETHDGSPDREAPANQEQPTEETASLTAQTLSGDEQLNVIV